MAVTAALAIGSLLASGGAVAAGVTGATVAGMSAGTLAGISGVLGIAGTVMSGVEAAKAQSAQASAEATQAELEAIEIGKQKQRESTQAAIEEASRERELRRVLATQRARVGASSLTNTGSILNIQQRTVSDFNRQQRQASLFSSLAISNLSSQQYQTRLAGQASIKAGESKIKSTLINTASKVTEQASSLIGSIPTGGLG